MSFDGKVVVVTGSTFGIGRGIALAFGREGAAVTIHGRSSKGLEECEKYLVANEVPAERIFRIQGPAEDEEVQRKLIERTVEHFGQLDVLVNNAGCYYRDGFEANLDAIENLDYIFELNVRTPVRLIQLAIPHLTKTKGNVVNVSSAAVDAKTSQIAFYCSSKAALNSLTESFAFQLAKAGVRVNAVSPGIIDDTNILKKSDDPTAQMVANLYFRFTSDYVTPMKRAGFTKEVASVVLFLANSTAASFVTGSNFRVDGGSATSMPSMDPRDLPFHLAPSELLQKVIDDRTNHNV